MVSNNEDTEEFMEPKLGVGFKIGRAAGQAFAVMLLVFMFGFAAVLGWMMAHAAATAVIGMF